MGIEAVEPAGSFYMTGTLFSCIRQGGQPPFNTLADSVLPVNLASNLLHL
jgi:hypothetical protein